MKPILALVFLTGLLHAQPAAVAENSAVVPVGKLEKDFYDWDKRHAEILAIKDRINPEIVLIGDSITHFWGGEPAEPKGNRGADAWKDLFGERKVLNLGFGWDRTQNVLFRIQDGELDGLKPKLVVLHIGTNNLSTSKNAPTNTPEQVAEGIGAIIASVKKKCPDAKIVLMGVFPRGEKADNLFRAKIAEINVILAKTYASQPGVTYLDITEKFLNADGSMSKEVMGDFLHPSAKGYAIWAEALKGYLP
ncbi:MAG: acetylhydrolase [Akkermansiaceae bacterium]|nr:acetylhydrolase [Akkermansiaceae bacterium]